ncbi:heme biosynthesis protein HemY [Paenalcaligenes niemegkensis]|uniref:heme biosynthesis HemY N-terminal domain-containing protein n=1 Tax=Paenalcaligenes niemegkensis TaxID=2895469 RepID=UPI001EE91C6A|nr:heme biosynthesis HemY N-terminal domain-containing protein [Paenalcaligenes niemegkensis]MCQ9616198.1 heme biosynthesis protein HemY [Paenalcaligenes niemegkensis]
MRTWFWTVILLVAAVALALVLRDHSGNVVIAAPPYHISFSLTFGVLSALAVFFGIYVFIRFLAWVSGSPERFRLWRGHREQKRDRDLLESGWLNILEGRYGQAEKDLSKLLSKTRSKSSKVLAGLAAARASHNLGEYNRRDEALSLAMDVAGGDPRLKVAAATASAEMYMDQGQPQQAIDLLQPLQDASSRYFHTTRLLLQAYRQQGEHERVYELTRLLLRRSAIDRDEALVAIETAAAARIMAGGPDHFKSLWSDLRSDEKTLPAIALAAAAIKEQTGEYDDAARILEAAINVRFDPRLIHAYAQCPPEFYARRLSKAEEWLRKHPHDSNLLAALGQLCLTGQLWGQGEHYLKRSMKVRNDMRIHALLGNLYDGLGRTADAIKHWRLSASVAGSLPVFVANRALPAADTSDDPTLIDGAFVGSGAEIERSSRQPIAASAADYHMDESHVPLVVAPAQVPADVAIDDSESDDDYFDSAPIPGVDTSIISDRPNRRID